MHHPFVERPHRGMGVGRRLIEGAIYKARALSCSYMMVGTHPDNSKAQAAYLACGFERRDAVHPRFHFPLDA
ncbi:GNAT family N-acetyltransferase [Ruegeria sp. HKCCA5763]